MEPFDRRKSARNAARRGLAFDGFEAIFSLPYTYAEDRSVHYPEMRIKTLGMFHGQVVHLVWTPGPDDEHPRAISIRPATPTEKQLYVDFLEGR